MTLKMDVSELAKERLKSDDRILVLKVVDENKVKNSAGLVDKRLFKGENRLHAYRKPGTVMWSFKYDSGMVPPNLRMQYTNFDLALADAKYYFKKRGIEIAEVIE